MRGDLIKRVLATVDDISEIHSEEILPLVRKHEDDIDNIQEDIQALFEITEMNFLVLSKALSSGLFDEKEPNEISEHLNQMQDEYLACVSLANFLSGLREIHEEESEESG